MSDFRFEVIGVSEIYGDRWQANLVYDRIGAERDANRRNRELRHYGYPEYYYVRERP